MLSIGGRFYIINNLNNWLSYIKKNPIFLTVFSENFINFFFDNYNLTFKQFSISIKCNFLIVIIKTNYDLGIAISIIIEDNNLVMAKTIIVAKNFKNDKYYFTNI